MPSLLCSCSHRPRHWRPDPVRPAVLQDGKRHRGDNLLNGQGCWWLPFRPHRRRGKKIPRTYLLLTYCTWYSVLFSYVRASSSNSRASAALFFALSDVSALVMREGVSYQVPPSDADTIMGFPPAVNRTDPGPPTWARLAFPLPLPYSCISRWALRLAVPLCTPTYNISM